MDVSRIGQGGQISFDNMSTKIDTGNSKQVTDVNDPQPVVPKASMGEGEAVDGQIKKDSPSEEEVKKALDKLSKFLEDDNTSVEYQFHNTFKNDLMIKIVNKNTNQVILEVPPKKVLDLVAKMVEMVGILFDKKA